MPVPVAYRSRHAPLLAALILLSGCAAVDPADYMPAERRIFPSPPARDPGQWQPPADRSGMQSQQQPKPPPVRRAVPAQVPRMPAAPAAAAPVPQLPAARPGLPRPQASAPVPITSCDAGGCWTANGRYEGGAGNSYLDRGGRLCQSGGGWMHCY